MDWGSLASSFMSAMKSNDEKKEAPKIDKQNYTPVSVDYSPSNYGDMIKKALNKY